MTWNQREREPLLCFGCSETLQILRGRQRGRVQHGGAAGDGPAADLRQQLQTDRLQDHGSPGRRQQGGEVRGARRRVCSQEVMTSEPAADVSASRITS